MGDILTPAAIKAVAKSIMGAWKRSIMYRALHLSTPSVSNDFYLIAHPISQLNCITLMPFFLLIQVSLMVFY
jgi:hypothetical protein